ncbi:MAG: hypothetical protein A2096_10140 [Spirochaetes bacterium GWF1_41_5]|nr:MAG: hypothetical protein A2096_10140 [Spirochaetes bacterium GWF1_41_5]HBE02532.1 hypothetical protein [Spirochaetia bacterium]
MKKPVSTRKKVLIFIIAYNAEKTIDSVIKRIPAEVFSDERISADILIISDASRDNTFRKADEYRRKHRQLRLTVLENPVNLGYGGNQKVGYFYAMKFGYDIVAMVHGDGQYAPEKLPALLEPLINSEAEAVYGSRMLEKGGALKGGMPLYKFIGNKILTMLQNFFLGSRLSEFHSGYRLYNVHALSRLPIQYNSNGFDFDTDIIIQHVIAGYNIKEIPIPTFYGEEVCHVNGFKYALDIIITTVKSRFNSLGIFYNPKFDIAPPGKNKPVCLSKLGYTSSHEMAISFTGKNITVLLLGDETGIIIPELKKNGCRVLYAGSGKNHQHKADKYLSLPGIQKPSDEIIHKALVLDEADTAVDPEAFLKSLAEKLSADETPVLFTIANINFITVRFMHLIGHVNYSREGILSHKKRRFFTFGSFRRLLNNTGYKILKEEGIPAPFPKALGMNFFSRFLVLVNSAFIKIWRGLFSYQIAFTAVPLPTLDVLLHRALSSAGISVKTKKNRPGNQL